MSEFDVEYWHMEHLGGTKDISLVLVTNRTTKRAVLINRWGKIGTKGAHSRQDLVFGSRNQAFSWANKKIVDKTSASGGYKITERFDSALSKLATKGQLLGEDYTYDAQLDKVMNTFRQHVTSTQLGWVGLPTTATQSHSNESVAPNLTSAKPVEPKQKEPLPEFYGSW